VSGGSTLCFAKSHSILNHLPFRLLGFAMQEQLRNSHGQIRFGIAGDKGEICCEKATAHVSASSFSIDTHNETGVAGKSEAKRWRQQ
jgi:hypothetical protein